MKDAVSRGLNTLLAMVEFEKERTRQLPRCLCVEADGVPCDRWTVSPDERVVDLPRGTRTVVVRDHLGTSRVRVEVEDGPFGPVDLDRGRLRIALEEEGGRWRVRIAGREDAGVLLAAAGGEDPATIPIGFTRLGCPEIDESGHLLMEAFCDPALAGREAVVEIDGLGSFPARIERQGAVRVVRRVPGGHPPGLVEPGRVRLRLRDAPGPR